MAEEVSVTIPFAGSVIVYLSDVDASTDDDALFDRALDKVWALDGTGLQVDVSDKSDMELGEVHAVKHLTQGNFLLVSVNDFTVDRGL